MSSTVLKHLWSITNCIFRLCYFPKLRKNAHITMIAKQGRTSAFHKAIDLYLTAIDNQNCVENYQDEIKEVHKRLQHFTGTLVHVQLRTGD